MQTARATGKSKTREQLCSEADLPTAVRECICRHDKKEASPHIATTPISDPANPAYRANGHVNGRAEMCVATHDLDEGTCLGCYPGSGRQWQRQSNSPSDAYEDGYCITLRDKRGFVTPDQADQNPLSRSNDYRTNVDDPRGPQGRKPNAAYAEFWQGGLPYIVFYTTGFVRKGEEILWDYGYQYWDDADMRKFRSLPLQMQANAFVDSLVQFLGDNYPNLEITDVHWGIKGVKSRNRDPFLGWKGPFLELQKQLSEMLLLFAL